METKKKVAMSSSPLTFIRPGEQAVTHGREHGQSLQRCQNAKLQTPVSWIHSVRRQEWTGRAEVSHCSATIVHTVIPTADVRKAAPPRPSPSLPRTLLLLLLRQRRSDFLKSDQVYAVRFRETPTTADSAPCALLARVQSCIGRWETAEEVKERWGWGCVETRTH